MTEYQGRSHFEADNQKRKLYEIGIYLTRTMQCEYKENEFSTILIFNFTFKPLKSSLETTLLGFEELDEFLAYDLNDLYHFFEHRFPNRKNRIKKPRKAVKMPN